MAAAKIGYRGNAIGISAGLGVALPLAAYAATISFDGVNDIVRMDAMPFAAGALAGVGMLALTGHMLDVHAERVEAERAEAERYASLYASTGSAAERAAQVARPAEKQSPAQTFIGKRFARQGQPDGVPVISRAVDALDEMEAWAEIDTMFSGDSPFSCDPARSKDMYQIALEELPRGENARPASTASAGASTAVAASAPAASRPMTQVVAPTADERQAEADRSDALASLYGRAAASRSYVPQMPTMTASAASQPVGAGTAASQAGATAPLELLPTRMASSPWPTTRATRICGARLSPFLKTTSPLSPNAPPAFPRSALSQRARWTHAAWRRSRRAATPRASTAM